MDRGVVDDACVRSRDYGEGDLLGGKLEVQFGRLCRVVEDPEDVMADVGQGHEGNFAVCCHQIQHR